MLLDSVEAMRVRRLVGGPGEDTEYERRRQGAREHFVPCSWEHPGPCQSDRHFDALARYAWYLDSCGKDRTFGNGVQER